MASDNAKLENDDNKFVVEKELDKRTNHSNEVENNIDVDLDSDVFKYIEKETLLSGMQKQDELNSNESEETFESIRKQIMEYMLDYKNTKIDEWENPFTNTGVHKSVAWMCIRSGLVLEQKTLSVQIVVIKQAIKLLLIRTRMQLI